MRIQPNQIVSLGYGKYVRSDEVTAVEPICEGRAAAPWSGCAVSTRPSWHRAQRRPLSTT